jgi:hypothetical protein
MFPTISVAVLHWPSVPERAEYLAQTLAAMKEHLVGLEQMDVVVSVLPAAEMSRTNDVLAAYPFVHVIHQAEVLGIGDHINAAKAACQNDVVLLVEDDWRLMRTLDLRDHARLLRSRPEIGMLHYTRTAGCALDVMSGESEYRILSIKTPSLYNDHPALHSRSLERIAGPMPLHQQLFAETVYNREVVRPLVLAGKLVIASVDVVKDPPFWRHIGDCRSVKREPPPFPMMRLPYGGAKQHADTPQVFEAMLAEVRPEVIVELGSGNGIFSRWLALAANCPVHSFDMFNRWRDVPPPPNLHQHVEDVLSQRSELVLDCLAQGRAILLCDNGNKPKEVEMYVPFLKTGDVLVVHDFGESKQEFIATMLGKRWNCCECTYQHIEHVVANGFERFHWQPMLSVAWGCFRKL